MERGKLRQKLKANFAVSSVFLENTPLYSAAIFHYEKDIFLTVLQIIYFHVYMLGGRDRQ